MKLRILKNETTIFDVFFALLAFTIPISLALPNVFLVLTFLAFLFKEKKKKINTYGKLVLLLAGFFIFKALLNKELIENFFIYKHVIVFVVISFLAFNVKNKNLVKKSFVFGVLSAVIFTISQIVIYYLKFDAIPLGNTAEAGELLIVHRPYFGFLCFLGVLCSTTLIQTSKNLQETLFYKIVIALFIMFVYVIVARLALGLLIIYVCRIFLQRVNLPKKKLFPLIGVFISLLAVIAINNKNIKKRLHIENTFDKTVKVFSNQEPRVVIWSCFFDVIKSPDFNYFTGYSDVKNIQLNLNDCYKQSIKNVSKNEYYLKTKFNIHNQFFDFFLQGGIIGLFLFLILLGCSFYLCRNNFTSLFVLVGFILFLIVENLFHRQLGVYLIGIFIPLFMKRKDEQSYGD